MKDKDPSNSHKIMSYNPIMLNYSRTLLACLIVVLSRIDVREPHELLKPLLLILKIIVKFTSQICFLGSMLPCYGVHKLGIPTFILFFQRFYCTLKMVFFYNCDCIRRHIIMGALAPKILTSEDYTTC